MKKGFFHIALSCLGMLMLVSACKKEETLPPQAAPVIGILSITPDTIIQYQDSVVIKLQYEDQNGDLGNSNPDIHDLEIKDSRLPFPDTYHVKPLSPDGYSLFIRGILSVTIPTMFLLGNGNVEPVTFSIRMRDRAGQWSTAVNSNPVYIKRE
jgi:hypothetical protein